MKAGRKEKEAIVQFLTNLKGHRNAERELYRLAQDYPQDVMTYIETLPKGWERIGNTESEILLMLRKVAARALRRKRKQ
jgi:hypothetical protein